MRVPRCQAGLSDVIVGGWPEIEDADYVERLIPAIQQAIADASADRVAADGTIGVSGPDLVNALLFLLATVIEPRLTTPAAARKMCDATAKELHQLMRDSKRLREAEQSGTSAIN